MWKLFQLSVAFAIAATNVQWPWTNNGAVVGFVALVAAVWATLIVSWAGDLSRRFAARRIGSHQGLQETDTSRITRARDDLVA